jgi:SAM-dependent methyltransferase
MEAFLDLGCDVVGVDPDHDAVAIAQQKCLLRGQPADRVRQGIGEALPFEADRFDVVWCNSVLEHVQDVGQTISEMVRVCRPEGHIYISTPEYRHIYEPHYKILLPMFLPRWMAALVLWFRGRPTEFLWTLQMVSSRTIGNLLQDHPVVAFQTVWSWPRSWTEHPTRLSTMTKWIARWFGIQRNQMWLVRKLTEPFE